jgi:hypothetical protein
VLLDCACREGVLTNSEVDRNILVQLFEDLDQVSWYSKSRDDLPISFPVDCIVSFKESTNTTHDS